MRTSQVFKFPVASPETTCVPFWNTDTVFTILSLRKFMLAVEGVLRSTILRIFRDVPQKNSWASGVRMSSEGRVRKVNVTLHHTCRTKLNTLHKPVTFKGFYLFRMFNIPDYDISYRKNARVRLREYKDWQNSIRSNLGKSDRILQKEALRYSLTKIILIYLNRVHSSNSTASRYREP